MKPYGDILGALRESHISTGRRIFIFALLSYEEIHQFTRTHLFTRIEHIQLIHLMEQPIEGKNSFSIAPPDRTFFTLSSNMGVLGFI